VEAMKKKLLGILCVFVAIFTMSHNAGAMEFTINAQQIWGNWAPEIQYLAISCMSGYTCSSYDGNYYWNGNHNSEYGWNNLTTTVKGLRFRLPAGATFTNGEYAQIRIYLRQIDAGNANDSAMARPKSLTSGVEVISLDYQNLNNSDSQIVITMAFTGNVSGGSWVYLTNAGNEFLTDSNNLIYLRESGTYAVAGVGSLWAVRGDNSQAIIDAINNSGDSQAINDLKDSIEEQQSKEDEAVQNIENQTPQDISSSGNTENQASSNLIDLIRSFVSALTSINTGNCDITLDFPSYAGGSRTVNICQNKDKAGNLISVFSSLTLIVFYIPLAIKLLTMIYNEIRSFTNG
jgi:hypothetical protein